MSKIPYQRSPRIVQLLNKTEVEIFKPSAAPMKPSFNLVMIVLPLIMTVAGATAMIFFGRRMAGNQNFIIFQIISLSTVAISYTIPFFMHMSQKKQYVKQTALRESSYKEQLRKHQEELQELTLQYRQQMNVIHPEPKRCMQVAETLDRSLWERGPTESDFMAVRVGVGQVAFPVDVKAPKPEGYDVDPLVQQALELEQQFRIVEDTPVTIDMKKNRIIGWVGPRKHAYALIRSVLLQAAVHHAPAELKLAGFYRANEGKEWDWMRFLPHVWNDTGTWRMICKEHEYTTQQLEWLHATLQRRTMGNDYAAEDKLELPQWLVLITDIRMLEDEALLPLLLKDAKSCGTCTMIVADRRELLPIECQLVIDVGEQATSLMYTVLQESDSKQRYQSKEKPYAGYTQQVKPDFTPLEWADRFARRLAPIELKKASAEDLPSVLTLFELLGISQLDQWDVVERWNRNRYPMTLPALVGVRGGSKPVELNIHDKIERKGHGPHGLVAGTTGSGKSEVIQSLIASLAVNYHPHDLAFMLIDYKGGGMSNIFASLPHVIATVTNLEEEGLIDRSKISLKAELERRQKLFAIAGNIQHIDEYYETSYRETHPLPHLVIIIDEFAQLKKDEPEFMSELISIAAIGRTLGVHLLLATQKPSGVVDDKIWSNSRYRICLRVQEESDSRDMLKVPNAAWITTPGQGYIQVGSNEWFEMVQFAWSGAPYYPNLTEELEAKIQVSTVELSGAMEKVKLPQPASSRINDEDDDSSASKRQRRKQLQVLNEHIIHSAAASEIQPLPGPWMPPLPKQVYLKQLYGTEEPLWLNDLTEAGQVDLSTWMRPQIGLIDDMSNQQQPPLRMNLSDGHWIIYGMPGTGKTTLLQTMLTSLVLTHKPDDVHVYAIDMGRMLRDFAPLPHAGAIIQEEETEKVSRLMKVLGQQLMIRKDAFSKSGSKSLLSYREETGDKLAAILLVIDGYASFRNAFPEDNERLEVILREGANFGIHVVVTANRISDMMEKLRSNIANALTFMLADNSDYYYAIGRPSRIPAELPEGRGWVKGKVPPLMFQAALPIEAEHDTERTRRFRQLVGQLRDHWQGSLPQPIQTIPERISLSETEAQMPLHDGKLPMGLLVEDLTPFHFTLQDGPYFMIGGRMESGKTSTLSAIAAVLMKHTAPEQLRVFLIDYDRNAEGIYGLRHSPHVQGAATDTSSLEAMLDPLEAIVDEQITSLQQESTANDVPSTVLLIDDIDRVSKLLASSYSAGQRLEALLKRARGKQFYIFAAANTNDWSQMWDGWVKEIKSTPVGYLLGTTDVNDLQLFNMKLPYEQSNKMLDAGEGFYVKRKPVRVKLAMIDEMYLQTYIFSSSV